MPDSKIATSKQVIPEGTKAARASKDFAKFRSET